MADWMTVPLLHFDYAGTVLPRVGLAHPTIAPYGAYPVGCNVGEEQTVLIGVQNDGEWQRLSSEVLDRPGLGRRPEFATNLARVANRAVLDAELTAVFADIAPDDLRRALDNAKIAYASVNDVTELSTHPQLRRTPISTGHGTAQIVAPPAQFRGEPRALGHVPSIGEHDDAIREEFAHGND